MANTDGSCGNTVRGATPHILFAHHSRSVHDEFTQLASQHGWSAETVGDVPTLLRSIAARPYDLVVADIDMSQGGASALLSNIRHHSPAQPLLLVAHKQPTAAVVDALRQGAVDYVEEPFSEAGRKLFVLAIETIVRNGSSVIRSGSGAPWHRQFRSGDFSLYNLRFPLLDWLVKEQLIDSTWRLKLTVALQEAITNAWEHGNLELKSEWREMIQNDGVDRYSLEKERRLKMPLYANRMLALSMEYRDLVLHISITDEGPGFELMRNARSPDAEPQCYGRGFQIIAGTVDEFGLEDSGRRIWMRKRLPALAAPKQ